MRHPKIYLVLFLFFYQNPIYLQSNLQTKIDQLDAQLNTAWEAWDLSTVATCYQKIVPLQRINKDYTAVLDSYIGWATAFYYQQKIDSAYYYLQQPVATNLNHHVPFEHTLWRELESLQAVCAHAIGDYERAATLTEQMLDFALQQDSINYVDVFNAYTNIGTFYIELGSYSQAKNNLLQGLQINKLKLNDQRSKAYVDVISNLAYIEQRFEHFATADSLYQVAKKTLNQLPANEINQQSARKIGTNVILNKIEQSDYDTALRLTQIALKGAPSDIRTARNYAQLGRIHYLKKQYHSAETAWNTALKLSQKSPDVLQVEIAELYNNLGQLKLAQQDYNNALQFLQKAISQVVNSFNHSTNFSKNPKLNQSILSKNELRRILLHKANALHRNGQSTPALATIELNLALIDSMRINYLQEGSKFVLLNNTQKVYETAIQIALDLNRPDLAFEYFERSKAALLLENIKRIQANQFANLPDSTLQQERDFKVEIAYQERQLLAAQRKNKQSAVDSLQSILFEKRQYYQQFLTELEQNNPRYYQLKYDTEVASLAQVQKELLQEDDLLLTYFMGEEYLYVLAISPTAVHPIKLANPTEILTQIEALRQLISQPKTGGKEFVTFNQLAHQLYETLIDSTAVDLLTANKNLLILPAAELGHLPFQILLKNKLATSTSNEPRYDTLSYLIKNHPISYGFSATLLLESTHNRSTHSTNFAGFAPVFNESAIAARSRNQLGKLTHSLQEIQGIQRLMQGDIFINENANVTNFREQLANYNILHLATHAQLNDEAPNDSRIYFHDDYLTAAEIYNLPLQADLVVLSACETGTGKLQRGEGLISLARAFAYANCPSLVTSLWQIDDATTADLMVNFYQNLQDGQTKPQALRTAQVDYLQRADISYQQKHPFYWGAFVQIGDPIAIQDVNNWWSVGGAFFLILLGGLIFFWKKD